MSAKPRTDLPSPCSSTIFFPFFFLVVDEEGQCVSAWRWGLGLVVHQLACFSLRPDRIKHMVPKIWLFQSCCDISHLTLSGLESFSHPYSSPTHCCALPSSYYFLIPPLLILSLLPSICVYMELELASNLSIVHSFSLPLSFFGSYFAVSCKRTKHMIPFYSLIFFLLPFFISSRLTSTRAENRELEGD